MIVKVQVSLFSSTGERRMLLYSKERTLEIEMPLSPKVEELMRERPKAFFEVQMANLIHSDIDLIFEREVPDPGW